MLGGRGTMLVSLLGLLLDSLSLSRKKGGVGGGVCCCSASFRLYRGFWNTNFSSHGFSLSRYSLHSLQNLRLTRTEDAIADERLTSSNSAQLSILATSPPPLPSREQVSISGLNPS